MDNEQLMVPDQSYVKTPSNPSQININRKNNHSQKEIIKLIAIVPQAAKKAKVVNKLDKRDEKSNENSPNFVNAGIDFSQIRSRVQSDKAEANA